MGKLEPMGTGGEGSKKGKKREISLSPERNEVESQEVAKSQEVVQSQEVVEGEKLGKVTELDWSELIIKAAKRQEKTDDSPQKESDVVVPRLESSARRELTARFMEKHREEITRSVHAAEKGRDGGNWRSADDLFEALR